MNLFELASNVETPYDLQNFLGQLVQNCDKAPETWKNVEIDEFLIAMHDWLKEVGKKKFLMDIENSPKSTNEKINWFVFAKILRVARIYE